MTFGELVDSLEGKLMTPSPAELERRLANLERTVRAMSDLLTIHCRSLKDCETRHNAHVQWHQDQRTADANSNRSSSATQPLTLAQAVEVLNKQEHDVNDNWQVIHPTGSRDPEVLGTGRILTEFEAVAIAEKYLREESP